MFKFFKELLKGVLKMLKIGNTEITTSSTVTKNSTDVTVVKAGETTVWEKATGNPNPVWNKNTTLTAQYIGEDGLTHSFYVTTSGDTIGTLGYMGYYGMGGSGTSRLAYTNNIFMGSISISWYDLETDALTINQFYLPSTFGLAVMFWEDNPVGMGGIIQNNLEYDPNTNKFSGAAVADYPSSYTQITGDRLGIYATEDGGIRLGIGRSSGGGVGTMYYSETVYLK
ncbi:MAG: hypothetical protein LBG21_06310 [Campylobacteraceae bacterium]|jgi:hypothetical protein|nr:hypothetical protein [Campylobacteraceae bacterium]